MDNQNLTRKCLLAISSFIFSIFLFLLILSGLLYFVCSKAFVNLAVNNGNYIELSYSALQTELEDLTIPSGLPLNFFHDKLSKDTFEKRVKASFAANIDKVEPDFSYDTVKNEFYELAYDYALTQNYAVGDEATEALMGFADECAGSYIRHVNPSSVKYVLGYFKTVKKYIGYAAILSVLFAAAAAFLLFRLAKGNDLKKYTIFALSGDFLFCTVLPVIALISGEIRKIALTSESLYSLTVTFAEGILWFSILIGVLIALVILSLSKALKNR